MIRPAHCSLCFLCSQERERKKKNHSSFFLFTATTMSLAPPRRLHVKIHLSWGPQGRSGMGKEISLPLGLKENWPKISKDLEELTHKWLNHPFTELLLTRRDTHSLSLQVCVSALLLSYLRNHFSVLSHLLLLCVSNNKLCTCICNFCLHDKCILHWGQRSPEKLLLASSPCWSGG